MLALLLEVTLNGDNRQTDKVQILVPLNFIAGHERSEKILNRSMGPFQSSIVLWVEGSRFHVPYHEQDLEFLNEF